MRVGPATPPLSSEPRRRAARGGRELTQPRLSCRSTRSRRRRDDVAAPRTHGSLRVYGFAAPPTPASPGERAAWLLGNMTLEQKIVLFHGPTDQSCHKSWCKYVGNVEGQTITTVDLNNKTEKVVIPPLTMNDARNAAAIFAAQFCCAILRPPVSPPSSLCSRDNASPGTTTAWPSGLTIAASFDAGAALEWGTGMGKEFYAKGSNIQLGPGVCLARVPRNGAQFRVHLRRRGPVPRLPDGGPGGARDPEPEGDRQREALRAQRARRPTAAP